MSLQPTHHSVSCNVKGVEPLTLTPSSSSSWPPHSQGTVEPRAWSSPGASGCLAGFVIQKGVRCSVDLQSKTICGSARRASTLGHIPFHPNCVYRFKICFWLQRSVSNSDHSRLSRSFTFPQRLLPFAFESDFLLYCFIALQGKSKLWLQDAD